MSLSKHELATMVIKNMDTSGVYEYAIDKLADFYLTHPEDFQAALSDYIDDEDKDEDSENHVI